VNDFLVAFAPGPSLPGSIVRATIRVEELPVHKAAFISPALVVAGILAGAGVPGFVMPPAAIRAQAASRVDAAQVELQNGRPAAFKALWSQTDEVTLSGGFGGRIEKGWPAISSRLDWVATRFSKGTSRIERIATHASGELGYVIQAEHLQYRVPGDTSDSTRDYRVTMIFRRQAGEWRIVHRQADSQLTRQ
jgi:ketosteroid isomerase-like protein